MNQEDLAGLLREHASRHAVVGATIGILRNGAVTTAYHGVADVRTGEPVTSKTLFSAGSLTKSMVATVIARLAEAGRLSLDDPVAGHVPELRGTAWAERATIRNLLANRSGLPLSAGLEFGFDGRPEQDDDAISRLAADVAAAAPAAGFWSYSNAGWCLLGRVIETVSGAGWEDAMRPYLAGSSMDGTFFTTGAATNAMKGRASGHGITAEGPIPAEPRVARAYAPAGTSIVSTVTDLLRFAVVHLDDPALAPLRVVHADVSIYGWFDSWCLGWGRFDWKGGQVWGWDGLVSGERSILRFMPAQRAAVALMTNSSTGRAMYRSLFADLMEPLFGISVPPLRLDPSPDAAGDLSRFAGDEQHFAAIAASLEQSIADLSDHLDAVRKAPGGIGQQAMDRDMEIHRLTARLRTLRRYGLDLCLGHMVKTDSAEPVYVGRLGLTDSTGRRLLIDWRSPAAEPFFGATHANPMGLASRRRYRWTRGRISDYWDEVFTAAGFEGHAVSLDDQSAFIASLGGNRSARMRDVLGTIQADQDAIIRAGSRGALVVDGGAGTGKTVVALHRAAYLLYSDPRLGHGRGRVLFVGPHQPYLVYVADVLPSLGEEGVQTCTLPRLGSS